MDKFYIGDIPSSFHYAVFNNNYLDLYDTPSPRGTVLRYRIPLNVNSFIYFEDTVNLTYSLSAQDIPVSSEVFYRSDFSDICSTAFIFIFCIILIFNIVTSVFKKGGLFSGLI